MLRKPLQLYARLVLMALEKSSAMGKVKVCACHSNKRAELCVAESPERVYFSFLSGSAEVLFVLRTDVNLVMKPKQAPACAKCAR